MRSLVAATILIAGCSCDDAVLLVGGSRDRSLLVGESFTASVSFAGCGGKDIEYGPVTWSTSDATILEVNAQTGKVTGLRVGQADILSSAPPYGHSFRVTVVGASNNP